MKYLAIVLLITHSFCNSTVPNQVADVAAAKPTISDSAFTLVNQSGEKITFFFMINLAIWCSFL
jgi:hypothetical protein